MTVGSKDLEALRETTSKVLLAVLWLHVPVAIAIGMARGADWLLPAALMAALVSDISCTGRVTAIEQLKTTTPKVAPSRRARKVRAETDRWGSRNVL